MIVADCPEARRIKRKSRQSGATVVEFALIVMVFLAFLFAIIEFARIMFLFNTLQEVTRRAASAASVSDSSNATVMDAVRQYAIFRSSPGGLIMMNELTDRSVRIDYLSVSHDSGGPYSMQELSAGSPPSGPAENQKNCLTNPTGYNCVRLVRARICDPENTASCKPMKLKPLISFFSMEISLPMATTFAKAQTFGAHSN